jgi:hypothetical protein
MDPNEIKRLVAHAKKLQSSNVTTPEAFVLSFIAWEAFSRRILRVGLAAHGLRKEEANIWLCGAHLSSKSGLNEAFESVYGTSLGSAKGIGHLFADLAKINALRNKYIHGRSRVKPEAFSKAATALISIIEADWSIAISTSLGAKQIPINQANPMGRITASNTRRELVAKSSRKVICECKVAK